MSGLHELEPKIEAVLSRERGATLPAAVSDFLDYADGNLPMFRVMRNGYRIILVALAVPGLSILAQNSGGDTETKQGSAQIESPPSGKPQASGPEATAAKDDHSPRIVADKARLKFKYDDFTFARLKYNSGTLMGRKPKWMIDYPDADKNFSAQLEKVTGLKTNKEGKIVELTDPTLKDYPFIYLAEPGDIWISDDEARILREYALDGGFIMMDDFWGTIEWNNVRDALKKVFPDREPIDLPLSHPVFNSFYEIREKPQVPAVGVALMIREQPDMRLELIKPDSEIPHYRGLTDDDGRLMVILCHNTDLADGWEGEGKDPQYDRDFTFKKAYPMGVNIVVHALKGLSDAE